MDWLNYHHLRYFWTVAREGTLARAAARLNVSQPSISEQIHELEQALGQKLFQKQGRSNQLTPAGHIALRYAEDIFALGQELTQALSQRAGTAILRLDVGVVDSFPKLLTNEILQPIFTTPIHLVCREGKMDDLLGLLAVHRLDLLLADEPPSSNSNLKTFSHLLGECGTEICAHPQLARSLRRSFPQSLHQAPALLPAPNTPFRRSLEAWFRLHNVRPRVVAEVDDLALMKVMAADGRGFIPVPHLALKEARDRYGFKTLGPADGCTVRSYAITAERRIAHPAIATVLDSARRIFPQL